MLKPYKKQAKLELQLTGTKPMLLPAYPIG